MTLKISYCYTVPGLALLGLLLFGLPLLYQWQEPVENPVCFLAMGSYNLLIFEELQRESALIPMIIKHARLATELLAGNNSSALYIAMIKLTFYGIFALSFSKCCILNIYIYNIKATPDNFGELKITGRNNH